MSIFAVVGCTILDIIGRSLKRPMRIFCTTILAWYLLIIAESFHTFQEPPGLGRTRGLTTPSRQFATLFRKLEYETLSGIHLTDLTTDVRAIVKESGIREGTVSVLSRHTTCAITINEMEERLVDDAAILAQVVSPRGILTCTMTCICEVAL